MTELLDCRRLTGPNLFFDSPCSVLDARCSPDVAHDLVVRWQHAARRMLRRLGWADAALAYRTPLGGVSVAIAAPIDALYAANAINEWAWASCTGDATDFDEAAAAVQALIDGEANAPLRALQAAANAQAVPFLWDDDEASVGLGRGAIVWPVRALPAPHAVDWPALSAIPVALVTGTNGKTTITRIAAHILRTAGKTVGVSSTESVAVDDEVVDAGDYSGPGGARLALRQRVDAAVLETARGGLLRRGLGVMRADAAVIANVAEDHLGDFGSGTLHENLDIKWLVARAVEADGVLVLNADDSLLVERAAGYGGRLAWFSVASAAGHRGVAFVRDGDELVRVDGRARERLCRVEDVPLALGGAAQHNVANALAAAALCDALGVAIVDIARGLATMSADANPGRGNVYAVQGFTVLVDFAHNPQATHAIMETARALPSTRRLVAFGQAGDRPDRLIRAATRHVWATEPARVVVSELPEYYRGRAPDEVYAIIRDELELLGARADQIVHATDEGDALTRILAFAQPGDLVVFLALADRDGVRRRLAAMR